MNCRNCRALIQDYLEEGLPPELAGEVRRHAAACPACRLELALARRIDQGLSRLAPPSPPADFTARLLAALPVPRPAPLPFWPQALSILACAVSTVAVLYGLLQHLSDLGLAWEAGKAWTTDLASSPGLPLASEEPGRAYAFLGGLQTWAADTATSLSAYLKLVSWVYSDHAPIFNLAVLGTVLLWLLYDYSQRARA